METSWVTFNKSHTFFFSFLLKRAVQKHGLLAAFLSVYIRMFSTFKKSFAADFLSF